MSVEALITEMFSSVPLSLEAFSTDIFSSVSLTRIKYPQERSVEAIITEMSTGVVCRSSK